jgi:type I restriction enzyme S subunit
MSENKKLIPKLRFPEFEKAGEWEERRLGEVGEIITGNTPSTQETNNYGGKRLFVSPADIEDQRYITRSKTTLTELGFSKTRKIKAGSILFVCIGSTIGKIAQNKIECATNQQINSLVPNAAYSSDFIYSLLEANSQKIKLLSATQAVPIINKSLFSSISLLFPSINEQQKIAACLSSLDDLIAAQAEKIELLKLHKKGLMQGLFPKWSKL